MEGKPTAKLHNADTSECPENLACSDNELDILHLRFERIGVLVDQLVHLVMDHEAGANQVRSPILFLNQELHDTDDELSRLREWLKQRNEG